MTLRICFLSAAHTATDKRVHYKEAIALVRAGFDVTHVVRETGEPKLLDGVKLVTFPGNKTIADRLRQLWRLYRAGLSVRPDVYHCNEVDSWFVGLFLKMRTGAKVVFDVHELYSSNLAETRFPKALRPLVVAMLKGLFAMATPFTDRFVLAKRSAAVDYPSSAHKKEIVVGNYVDLDADVDPAQRESVAPRDQSDFVLLHLGAINRQRGWPQLLDALAATRNQDIRLRVIGAFGDNSQAAFMDRVRALGLEKRVEFQPWIPYSEVIAATRACHVGLIVFQPVMLNFTHALPHKLFDYMLAELPVVIPDFTAEVSEIVADANCGLAVDVTNVPALAAAFDRLAGAPELCRQYGENGRKAVLDRYNWDKEAAKLVAMYRELALSPKFAQV